MTGPAGPSAADGPTPPKGGPADEADGARVPKPPGARRFPGWLLIPLGGAAGWVVSGWGGAGFGGLVGLLIWRSRAG